MRLENLKVRYELSKFGYYRIEKQLKLLFFSKLTFPNYLRSKADTYFVTELRNLFVIGTCKFFLLYSLIITIHNTPLNSFRILFE